MNDEEYDKPYSSSSYNYHRPYFDEDNDYQSSYVEPDSETGSKILESYYGEEDFTFDEVIDDSVSNPSLKKDLDDAWDDDYDPWISDDDEEDDFDTSMLDGELHLGSETKTGSPKNPLSQELLDWAKNRTGINVSSYVENKPEHQPEQVTAAAKRKKQILDGLEDAFSARSKVLTQHVPNILDSLDPKTSLVDSRIFDPTMRVKFSRSKADILYDRLRNGDTTEPVTWYGQDMLDRIGLEELCELINIDVDPESEAGDFLRDLRDTYVAMIDIIMRLANLMDKNLGVPRHKGTFEDPRSYAVVKNYKNLTAYKSKEELENLAFEFTGDEDPEYVEKIAEAVFESLNIIFKKASGWGNGGEVDF